MSSSIKVVDVNEEATQLPPDPPIEEAPIINEEPKTEAVNEEVIKEKPTEVKKEEEEPPKPETLQDKVRCPKCNREMFLKTFKYKHEKNCQGKLSEKPVKPYTKAKAKAKPQPPPEEVEEPPQEPPRQIPPWKNKPAPQPLQPVNSLMQHYQLLQQEYNKQKQQRYSALCQNMFATKTKKKWKIKSN